MAKKKRRWLRIGIPVAVVLILAIFIMANLQKNRAKATEVFVEKAMKGQLVESVSGTGRVQPEVQVKISANVAGRITDIRIKEGDWVKKGDLLVKLDQENYLAAVEQAQSAKKSSEAALQKSKSELARAQELSQRGMASQADLESAQAQFQLNSAEVERAQAFLKQAHDNLSKTSIYSPMDGIVSLLNKEIGEIALGAQFQEDVILIVADLSKMEVLVEVDENDVVNVALQDTAKIKIDAYPDTSFKGEVREIAHTATTRGLGTAEELTNFQVKITLLEIPPNLRPGMSATSDIITEVRDQTLHIPIQCVVMREPLDSTKTALKEGKRGKRSKKGEAQADTLAKAKGDSAQKGRGDLPKPIEVIFKYANGKVIQVPVKTGISSEVNIEVLAGVAEGDSIVSGPFRTLSQKLKDGENVKVKTQTGPERRDDQNRQNQ